MSADGIGAERVDFVAVPTRDRDRAERFYAETLGLAKNPLSTETWVEFETGNLTLASSSRRSTRSRSRRCHSGRSRPACPTSPRRGAGSRRRVSSSRARSGTPASARSRLHGHRGQRPPDPPPLRAIRGRPHAVIDVERVDYVRVPVTDMDAANHFYGEVLGLERNPNSPDDDWVEYEVGNLTLAVMTPETHDSEFAPLPPATIALRAPDVAAARETLASAGLEVGEMWDSGVCRGVSVFDPAGNRLLLHRRYAPYADGTTP